MQPPLLARGISVTFGADEALRDVSLEVHAGETLAMLGSNGSGKSTLIRAMLGLVPLSLGSVLLFGTPVVDRTRQHAPWHRVGYVPQRTTAAGGVSASVREVVESGLLTERGWRLPRDAARRVAGALDTVGLSDRAGRAVATLSGGQQQRVLIARALVREPDLLVLDEPLAGVDAENQDAVARVLHAMTERGTTAIVVLHEPGALAPLIDRAVVLDKGCLTYDGPPPAAVGAHAMPGHDHVHPHAPGDAQPPALSRGVT